MDFVTVSIFGGFMSQKFAVLYIKKWLTWVFQRCLYDRHMRTVFWQNAEQVFLLSKLAQVKSSELSRSAFIFKNDKYCLKQTAILKQLERLHACFSWEHSACENHVWRRAAAEPQYLLSRGRAERWQQQLGSGQDGFQSSVLPPSRPGCCNYEDVKEEASQVRCLNIDKCPKADAQFGVSPAGRLSPLWPFLGSTHHQNFSESKVRLVTY